jgi:hypothetical protein
MSAAIFLGPSLAVDAARRILDATYLPPVRQGDVYRVVRDLRPRVIGIVDGYFHQVPSVWHKEILWAIREGAIVLGAASMGALRATELHEFGMRGVGKIFAAFRDGRYPPYDDPFEDDDEVAVVHGPPETGFVALSDALVDIRETLAAAERAGIVDAKERDRLLAAAKQSFYQERSVRALGQDAARLGDAATVVVAIPPEARAQVPQLIARLEAIEVDPDVRARVVVDEKTGTIVIGEAVALRPAAITFGALTVEVEETPAASQPAPLSRGAATTVVPHTAVKVNEAEQPMRLVKKAATVGDVAAALAALGAKPRDLVSILRALKAAGALRADLETL